VSKFGVPRRITSDRGSQFTGSVWFYLGKEAGFEVKHTTAYHPQSNGVVERLHRTLKAALRARLQGRPDWPDHVPWVLLGIRNAPKPDLGDLSPAEIVFGQKMAVPGGLVRPRPVAKPSPVDALLPDTVDYHGQPSVSWPPLALSSSPSVWVRREQKPGLAPAYVGPFKVLKRNEKTFVLQKDSGPDEVSIDRLKPAF